MADDGELEKRAVEELLKETSRARVRAETMGPAGWMKCPLRSTNKRFLLNTLRTTIPQRRPAGHSGEQTSECRRRSRTPSTDHRDSHRRHRDEDSHRDSREHSLKDGHKRDKDRNTCHRDGYKYRGVGDNDRYRHRDKKHRDKSVPGHKTHSPHSKDHSPSEVPSSCRDRSLRR
ncbi:protein POLR1D-like isoform X1 [Oncorhynchus mykiss]|uniref:Si:ch211-140b10.6 n=1 Tax=Oncorhynchus mykiss TaxID=8022 RepID=A0A8C7THS6_ONCMY|nr:protein POLR1D-like isoform X2 [Oncorhynchus mykiss]XP_036790885.1 protein POLR1D-like isoform X1 [Oncorhynchus mykiss]